MWLRQLLNWLLQLVGGPPDKAPKQVPAKTTPKTPRKGPEVYFPDQEDAEEDPATEDMDRVPTDPGVTKPRITTTASPVVEIVEEFTIDESFMIPVQKGHAVSAGWTSYAGSKPMGVTWHWSATWDRATCDKILGGDNPLRKGEASAHYCIGRSFEEGVSRYVSLENRSWHAGANQIMRWDGKDVRHGGQWWSGARTTVGIETANVGFGRSGVTPNFDWIPCNAPNGKQEMLVQPWTDEQVAMCIAIGKEIQRRWPHITYRDHHGHLDVCPGFKVDPAGFPFARVLQGIYPDEDIYDVWTPVWNSTQRQRVLIALGFDLGTSGPNKDGADGDWGRLSDSSLRKFQKERGLEVNGYWTTFVCWAIFEALMEKGLDMAEVSDPEGEFKSV